MESDLKAKMAGEEVKEPTPEDLQKEQEKRAMRSAELEYQLRAKLGDGKNENSSSSDSSDSETREEKEKRLAQQEKAAKERRKKFDDYDYSSGVESDNDVDLLVE